MLPTPTPNGIPKLRRLTGKFHVTSIIVQVLDRSFLGEVGSHYPNATVSDGVECLPALYEAWRTEKPGAIFKAIYRITEAIFCSLPERCQGVLVIRDLERCADPLDKILGNPRFSISPYQPVRIEGNPVPIAALPYFRMERFHRIRVFVTYKSRLSDPRYPCDNSSMFFVLHILDESGEMRAGAQGAIAEEIYDRFEEGKTYYITDFAIDSYLSDVFFSFPNQWTMKFKPQTLIEECPQIAGLPEYRFKFITIPSLCKIELGEREFSGSKYKRFRNCVDVIGIVKDVSLLDEYKSSTKIPTRQITIFDQSRLLLLVMLWSYNAEDFTARPGDIVGFRHARLTEYLLQTSESEDPTPRGRPIVPNRILSVLTPSTIHVEPKIEECFALRQWYNSVSRPLYDFRISMNGEKICEQEEPDG